MRRLSILLLSSILVITTGSAASALDEPPPRNTQALLTTDDAHASIVIEELVKKYGITPAEAQRRLNLEKTLPQMHRQLAAKYPDTYGGFWLDQDNGGTAVFLATDPATIVPDLSALSSANPVRVSKVEWSIKALTELRQRVIAAAGGDPTVAGIDFKNNAVTVPGNAPALAGVLKSEGARVHQEEPNPPRQLKGPAQGAMCLPLSCDPPMRGGVRLDIQRESGEWSGCTAGFPVTDGGWQYVLTAGHCILNEYHDRLDDLTYHNGIPVGKESGGSVASFTRVNGDNYNDVDFAIIPYRVNGPDNYSTYWYANRAGRNQIAEFRNCVPGTTSVPGYSCSTTLYPITRMWGVDDGTGNVFVGQALCTTGTGSGVTSLTLGGKTIGAPANRVPGTRCGPVKSYKPWRVTVDICTAPGDSGGPLYDPDDNAGVGIVRDGDENTTGETCKGNGYTDFVPLAYLFDKARSMSGKNFGLVTWN